MTKYFDIDSKSFLSPYDGKTYQMLISEYIKDSDFKAFEVTFCRDIKTKDLLGEYISIDELCLKNDIAFMKGDINGKFFVKPIEKLLEVLNRNLSMKFDESYSNESLDSAPSLATIKLHFSHEAQQGNKKRKSKTSKNKKS